MPVRAILFDLDGTIVDSERESAEGIARAMRDGLGLEMTQAERDFVIGHSWVDIYENLTAHHAALTWSRDQLIAASAAARGRVFEERGIRILPGAVEAVHRFAHLERAIVTGSSRVEAAQSLTHTALTDVFDVVFASEDYPRSKPAPDGYLAAAQALGVPPGECVVVEDSFAGVAAGRAAGALVVAVRAGNFDGQDQSAAHIILDTLEQLTSDLLESLVEQA